MQIQMQYQVKISWNHNILLWPISDQIMDEEEASKPKREIKLGSVKTLRKSIDDNCHEGLRDLISNHSFVGCADREFALIQHSTKLYVVNIINLTRHLFYQLMLSEFGNAAYIKLNPPAKIRDMVRFALDMEEAGWTEVLLLVLDAH